MGSTANATSVVLQSNGQIIVAGNSDNGVIFVRYNTNGSIDASFGTNGIVNFPNAYNAPDIFGISDVNIANDARIDYSKLNLIIVLLIPILVLKQLLPDNKLAHIPYSGNSS